jgi:hypothetical protein
VTIAFTIMLVPAVVAGFALGGCGGSTTASATAPGPNPSGMPQGQGPGDMSAMISDALDALVDDGTLTASQKTAVVEALGEGAPAAVPQGGTPPTQQPQASPPTGQDPATKAQAPGGADMFADALDALVEDGTVTSAQADAISQAITDALLDVPGARSPPADTTQI